MEGWSRVTISDVATEVTVGHVGSMADDYEPTGIPFLRSLNVEPFKLRMNGVKFINHAFHASLRKSALAPGDVVIVRTGKPGACTVIPDQLPEANCSDLVIVRCSNRVRPHFLSYVVNALAGHHIAAHTVGAVQQHFNVGSARTLAFQLPPIGEQDKILGVLRALDDKIELNQRMNETLEASAQALFRDWFVDFGPTRAKAKGSPAYLAPDLWSLFPDRLDDDGVPDGWDMSSVGEEFALTMGQSPPGDTYNDEGVGLPFFQGRTDFGFRYPSRRKFCAAPTRIASSDDTLISVRAPVGDLNMAWECCCIGRGVAAARHRSGSRSYTYYAMHSIQSELEQFEHTGTVFGAINKVQFERLRIMAPQPDLIDAYEKQVGNLDDQIRANTAETDKLAETRDTLLPKLMSGEIGIADMGMSVSSSQ